MREWPIFTTASRTEPTMNSFFMYWSGCKLAWSLMLQRSINRFFATVGLWWIIYLSLGGKASEWNFSWERIIAAGLYHKLPVMVICRMKSPTLAKQKNPTSHSRNGVWARPLRLQGWGHFNLRLKKSVAVLRRMTPAKRTAARKTEFSNRFPIKIFPRLMMWAGS